MRPAAKQRAVDRLRRLHLLQLIDTLKFMGTVAAAWPANRRFRREHPDYPVPPYPVAFDAYGYVDWRKYRESGIAHAKYFASLIDQFASADPLRILEWGCGPGRVIRHLKECLRHSAELSGTDLNGKSIAWCREHLPGIAFAENQLEPPLPFGPAEFDAVLCRSVFTHLSESMHFAWRDELLRVLKPGGLLILTAHGDYHAKIHLQDEEVARYAAGEIVVRGGVGEGKKWFAAFQSPGFMRERLLKDLEILAHQPGPVGPYLEQDVWVARKPRSD